jgi:hypothetical protein
MAAEKKTDVEEKTTAKKAVEKMPDTVIVHLDDARDGEPEVQYVSVNGKSYTVNKGEDVEVPLAVAEVLVNSKDAMGRYKNYVREKEYKTQK